MPVHNSDIANIFNKVADLLEIQGANQFRIRAYRDAARTVGGLSESVADMVAQNEDLSRLPGIGKDLAEKIRVIVSTGKLPLLEELEQSIPPELSEIMKIAGLGAKKIHAIYTKLGIKSTKELEKAAKGGKIRELPGFGEKTEQNILEEVKRLKGGEQRTKLVVAQEIAEHLLDYLKREKDIKDIIVAGSYRRRKETVKDLDILVTCKENSGIMERFVTYDNVGKIVSRGDTRSTVLLRSGFQVDLRVVPQESYGAALHYFTGSMEHNVAIRKIAVKKNLKINEYGVFKGEKRIGGATEEEIFEHVGLPYIEPELRENRGEIEAARKNQLPGLITLDAIRGDLHTHTKLTDGRYTLEEMVQTAQKYGYEYIANTEHSKHVTVARGLDEKRLARQIKEIDRLNGKLKGITVLKSIEVDILEDGSLDLPDDILKELDLTVCSIHYKFNLPVDKQTDRVIRAMDNPYFNIFAHPTGRLINERKPYEIDIERIIKAAKERGCFLELNAHPDRLDLDDIHCKMAKEIGAKIAISTDAHSITDLDYMQFGIGQARRGWLEPEDVINTRNLHELLKLLKRK